MDGIYSKLNAQIDEIYDDNKTTMVQVQNLEECFNQIQSAISKELPEMQLFKYGSTVNGLGTLSDTSDLDLTLIVPPTFNKSHRDILLLVHASLKKHIKQDAKSGIQLKFEYGQNMIRDINAGYLLPFHYLDHGKGYRIEVDLMINKLSEIYHSGLLHQYSKLCPKYNKLAIVLKIWNKMLSDDKNKRLNSFSIYLMLIAYMQHKKYLPNLQAIADQV